jgi:Flp pilus assembly pilin Flp
MFKGIDSLLADEDGAAVVQHNLMVAALGGLIVAVVFLFGKRPHRGSRDGGSSP